MCDCFLRKPNNDEFIETNEQIFKAQMNDLMKRSEKSIGYKFGNKPIFIPNEESFNQNIEKHLEISRIRYEQSNPTKRDISEPERMADYISSDYRHNK